MWNDKHQEILTSTLVNTHLVILLSNQKTRYSSSYVTSCIRIVDFLPFGSRFSARKKPQTKPQSEKNMMSDFISRIHLPMMWGAKCFLWRVTIGSDWFRIQIVMPCSFHSAAAVNTETSFSIFFLSINRRHDSIDVDPNVFLIIRFRESLF